MIDTARPAEQVPPVARARRLPWLLVVAFVTLSAGSAAHARKAKGPNFPIEQFRTSEETARWLLAYDWMAWHSSDLVMQEPEEERAKLGREWFCFESGGTWHAVYGRYDRENDRYDVAFHYVFEEGDEIERTSEAVEPGFLLSRGRALRNSLDRLAEALGQPGFTSNAYIRTLADGTLEVWLLPAWQTDGTLVFGGDARFVLNGAGTEIHEEHLDVSKLQATKPDAQLELHIDRRHNDVPSPGDVFFILMYRKQFKSVTLWNHCSATFFVESDAENAWMHVESDKGECKSYWKRKAKERARTDQQLERK